MRRTHFQALSALMLLTAVTATAQLSAPPSGDNQVAAVTQHVGPVKITVDYSSPKVHHPDTKEDRRGKIWGTLVPMGLSKNAGYGTCTDCPWRAGANLNTTVSVSHDVKVEGQTLPAGKYGLFMIPGEQEWTVIFSKDNNSWGHYWYDVANDALRVQVKPAKSEYHEWLTYDFPVRDTDKTTLAMKWEDLQVPINITVPNVNELYLEKMAGQLETSIGFDWKNWLTAAQFALEHKLAPEKALAWARTAATPGFTGNANFQTLSVLADAQEANSMTAEAKKTREQALAHATAGPSDLHQYARGLLAAGKKQEALAIWEQNQKKHGNAWPVNVGLARGYSAVGRYKDALKYARLAVAQAPDENNKRNLEAAVKKLEAGKDMNQ